MSSEQIPSCNSSNPNHERKTPEIGYKLAGPLLASLVGAIGLTNLDSKPGVIAAATGGISLAGIALNREREEEAVNRETREHADLLDKAFIKLNKIQVDNVDTRFSIPCSPTFRNLFRLAEKSLNQGFWPIELRQGDTYYQNVQKFSTGKETLSKYFPVDTIVEYDITKYQTRTKDHELSKAVGIKDRYIPITLDGYVVGKWYYQSFENPQIQNTDKESQTAIMRNQFGDNILYNIDVEIPSDPTKIIRPATRNVGNLTHIEDDAAFLKAARVILDGEDMQDRNILFIQEADSRLVKLLIVRGFYVFEVPYYTETKNNSSETVKSTVIAIRKDEPHFLFDQANFAVQTSKVARNTKISPHMMFFAMPINAILKIQYICEGEIRDLHLSSVYMSPWTSQQNIEDSFIKLSTYLQSGRKIEELNKESIPAKFKNPTVVFGGDLQKYGHTTRHPLFNHGNTFIKVPGIGMIPTIFLDNFLHSGFNGPVTFKKGFTAMGEMEILPESLKTLINFPNKTWSEMTNGVIPDLNLSNQAHKNIASLAAKQGLETHNVLNEYGNPEPTFVGPPQEILASGAAAGAGFVCDSMFTNFGVEGVKMSNRNYKGDRIVQLNNLTLEPKISQTLEAYPRTDHNQISLIGANPNQPTNQERLEKLMKYNLHKDQAGSEVFRILITIILNTAFYLSPIPYKVAEIKENLFPTQPDITDTTPVNPQQPVELRFPKGTKI